MSYKISIELFQALDMIKREFESNSTQQILQSFDQIDWQQQIACGCTEDQNGNFPFFQIEQQQTGRTFGGLFVVYTHQEFNFMAHAELYQKQQKSSFFGLFKSEEFPSFDHKDLPFDVFKTCLENFLRGNDVEVERLMKGEYPSYAFTGDFD